MKIQIRIDRRAALLKGRELNELEPIEITTEQAGDLWPVIVSALDLDSSPPVVRPLPLFPPSDDATAEAFLEAARAAVAQLEDERQKQFANEADQAANYAASVELAIKEIRANDLNPRELYGTLEHWSAHVIGDSVKFQGFGSPSHTPVEPIPWTIHWINEEAKDQVQRASDEWLAAQKETQARVEEANRAALEAAQPAIKAELARRAEEKAREEAEAKAAMQAMFQKSLETGIYERETSSYNHRRYGRPWIARVSLDGTKLSYDFADGTVTADFGNAGMISIPCQPGDVIAHGQKDLRRPDRSEHTILRMRENGSMEELSKTEAVRYLRDGK